MGQLRQVRGFCVIFLISFTSSRSSQIEFSKDVLSLALESTLESRCVGNVFISTPECDEHISFVTQALSSWAPPVILISYQSSFRSLSPDETKKWLRYLQWKGKPCSIIFICDLSRSASSPMAFLDYPRLIRHFDQVLYFSDFDWDFDNEFAWRVLGAERRILQYTEILLGIKVVNRSADSESLMKVSTVCTYCKSGPDYENAAMGTWQRNKTMLANFFSAFDFQKEASFHNFTFKIGYLNYRPHFSCYDVEEGNSSEAGPTTICSGVEWEMLDKISKSLEFVYELHNFTLAGHGVAYDDTNTTGMLGSIRNNSIDLAVGGVSVTPERAQIVDFTKIFQHEPIVFVVEKRSDIYILGIWLAFQPEVWPVILLTIIVISTLFKFILRRTYDLSMTYGFQFSISSLLGQPLSHPFMTRKSRLLMKLTIMVWWFGCITIGTLYNTSLITSLINPVTLKEPESLHDLVRFGYKFVVGCKQGVVYELLQHGQEDQLIGDVAFKLIKERLASFDEQEQGSPALTAFVMEESRVEEINWRRDYGFKSIQIIKERLFLTGYGWAVKSQAPYKEKIDTALGRLSSAGLINYWYSLYSHQEKEPKTPEFKLRKKLGQIHMNLEILQGAFIFLVLGCFLAGIVFFAELWYKYYTFRFFTLEEIKRFYNKWVVKLDFQKELVRVGQQSLIFISPLDIQNELGRSLEPITETPDPTNPPKLSYLK